VWGCACAHSVDAALGGFHNRRPPVAVGTTVIPRDRARARAQESWTKNVCKTVNRCEVIIDLLKKAGFPGGSDEA
jgi:hypothetical protein